MKRPLSTLVLVLALPLIALQAEASPITVGFKSSGLVPVNPLMVPGGSFSEPGLAGSLNLDTSVPSTEQVNTAVLTIGQAAPSFQTGGFDLSFLLTFGGTTKTLTQHAIWGSSQFGDAVLSFEASKAVQFGNWNVELEPFLVFAGVSSTVSTPVMADFADPPQTSPVPEPASIVLLATGLVGAGLGRWRKRTLAV